jgi:hypothetical protein
VQVRPLRDLAFLPDSLTYPLELSCGLSIQVDNVVQGVRDLARNTNLRHRHPDREIAFSHGGQNRQKLLCV